MSIGSSSIHTITSSSKLRVNDRQAVRMHAFHHRDNADFVFHVSNRLRGKSVIHSPSYVAARDTSPGSLSGRQCHYQGISLVDIIPDANFTAETTKSRFGRKYIRNRETEIRRLAIIIDMNRFEKSSKEILGTMVWGVRLLSTTLSPLVQSRGNTKFMIRIPSMVVLMEFLVA